MKHSIFILAASISISLFIRICCAVGVTSLDSDSQSGSGTLRTPENVYEQHLRANLLLGGAHTSSQIDAIVKQWLQEIESTRFRKHSEQRRKALASLKNFKNVSICGRDEPPFPVPFSPPPWNPALITPFKFEFPVGCEYNETRKYLVCKDDQITALPPRLPPDLSILDLNATRIKWLQAHAMRNVSINTVRLFQNTIEYINKWAFSDVDNLMNLMIVDNEVSFLAYDLYIGLNKLMFLDLRYNLINLEIYKNCPKKDEEDIESVLPELRMLRMSGNPLGVIPHQMYGGLKMSPLNTLYLDECFLTEIHPEAFSYLTQLETLNLNSNTPELMAQLFNPTLNFLAPLHNLKSLYLANNRLSQIPLDAMSSFSSNLEVLDISGSVLYSLTTNDLSNLPNLKELYLNDAGLLSIDDLAFEQTPKLEVLQLKNNRLRQLPAIIPSSLTKFFFSRDSTLSRVDPKTFQNLNKLVWMELEGVDLETITRDTFNGSFRSKANLYLNNCNIRDIKPGAFQNLSISVLSIQNNPLSKLDLTAFSEMPILSQLSLTGCSLALPPTTEGLPDIPESLSSFPYLPLLSRLELNGNRIIHLTPQTFQNLPSLEYLILSNNPIESWTTRLFPERHTVYSNSDSETSDPYYFFFSATRANVQLISKAMLQDFLGMSVIDLSGNKFICDPNACRLRDMMVASLHNYRQDWVLGETYECYHPTSRETYRLLDLTLENCVTDEKAKDPIPEEAELSSQVTELLLISAACVAVTSTLIILAYRNRVQLKLYLHLVKFQTMNVTQAEEKEDDVGPYDFDVFISYHHEDSAFIEDVFLPEIEEPLEAKNLIYYIDLESSHNLGANDKLHLSESLKRFKVCLHQRDFAAGVPITENIVECIDRSRKTVIFASQTYMESQWCTFEMNLVYHRLLERRRNAFLLVLMEQIPQDLRTKVLNYLMVSKTYLKWPGAGGTEEERRLFWKRMRNFLSGDGMKS